MAGKTTFGTRTELTTPMADLGSVVRLNPDYFNTFSFSFVLDEALQLEETPVTQNPIKLLSSMLSPNTFQVFQNNLVSVKVENNILAYTMVHMLHPTSFSPREFLEQSLAGTSAFALKLGTQVFELPLDLLDFSRIIKPAVRTDGKVVYSEVNAQNYVLRSIVLLSGSNLFGECEQEETPAFFINPKQALFNIPTKILFVAARDIEIESLSAIEQSQNQIVTFDISTSWEVVSNRGSLDDWLGLGFLNNPTSLSHTSDSYLRWEIELLSDGVVDGVMELEVFSNLIFPSVINAKLQSFGVGFNSGNYFRSWIDTDFCSDYTSHNVYKTQLIFKSYGGEFAFLPQLKQWVSSEHVL